MNENTSKSIPKELNFQKKDILKKFLSNSQFHYKDISNFNYEHRIRLNPLGESKTMELRNDFPLNHIQDSTIKKDYLSEINSDGYQTAFDKADIQAQIRNHIKKQKYQNLLEKDKHIENLCEIENKGIKAEIEKRKMKLKLQLTRIINDALLFSKKNNPVKSMLPENINEIVDQVKKQTQDMSFSLNVSNLSGISTTKGTSKPKKNDFLKLLGVDLENLTVNHVNIDIDKAWKFIVKLAKGRKIEDILRLKVVNAIMTLTEKKASEKAKRIYERLEIYNKYMENKKLEEIKKKQKEEEEKYQEMVRKNPKEVIRLKMLKSINEAKKFNQDDNKKNKKKFMTKDDINLNKNIKKKKMKKSESAILPIKQKRVIKLNAYKDINTIMDFIENSKKESQSKLCKDHFNNIKMTKSMDINLKKMMKKNELNFK